MKPLDKEGMFPWILAEIEKAKPIGVRPEHWETVWSEEKEPPYFGNIVRDYNDFFEAPGYEKRHLQNLLEDIVPVGHVHEFGCGPGANLQTLSNDGRRLVYGYDWSQSACDTVLDRGFPSMVFDMLDPKGAVRHPDIALTVHSMEQLGKDFMPFVEWLRKSKFKVAIHIEPVVELYDPHNILDYLAIQYHHKRGYLDGLLSAVEAKRAYRTYFGGMMHEAYSVVIWYPS